MDLVMLVEKLDLWLEKQGFTYSHIERDEDTIHIVGITKDFNPLVITKVDRKPGDPIPGTMIHY